MTAKDQAKILNAGFTIIRKRDFVRKNKSKRFEIFQKTPQRREWHSRNWLFSGVTERENTMKELLKNPTIIED
jgi:hypothetical protein